MNCVLGGIGDFLQSIESVKASDQIRVYTHQDGMGEFFSALDVSVAEIVKFDHLDDVFNDYRFISDSIVSRKFFQNIPLPSKSGNLINNFKKNKSKVVGVQPVGSSFSNNFLTNKNHPTKKMSLTFVESLCDSFDNDTEFLFFGKEDELREYQGQISNARFISHSDIWDSLAHVLVCDIFIGVDSAFKTMSSMNGIKTIVFVSDYEDDFRDKTFIKPYEEIGILKSIKYTQLNNSHLTEMQSVL